MAEYINREKKLYIDREKLIEALNENKVPFNAKINEIILFLPRADVRENVRGEWLHWARSDECSVCGYDTGKYEAGTNFCPHCGADMRRAAHED